MLESLWALFDRGGSLLWVILAFSTLMWALLLERLDFFWRLWPRRRARILRQWRPPASAPVAAARREVLRQRIETELGAVLIPVEALIQALPLLGLLGTVNGMIKVFDVLTMFGTTNARAMAAGISEALITTLAGLVTALSGLWLTSYLRRRVRLACERLALRLSGRG